MAQIKILDFQDCVDLSEDETQLVLGGSWVSKWLRQNLGIPETDFDPTRPVLGPPAPPAPGTPPPTPGLN